jgi:hypothetical protein
MSLNLSATTHTLEVTTTGTGTVHVEVSFTDTSGGVATGGSQTTTIISATTTPVCSAPAASTVRTIDEMTVMAVGANGVTVKKDVSATETTLIGSLTLAAGERAQFVSARGWRVFNADGSEKIAAASAAFGLVSHIGGNSVSAVTRMAFSNASNVTWSLSTAVGAATVLASVAAGGETKSLTLATFAGSQSGSITNATDSSFSGNPLVFQSLGTANDSLYSRANVFWRLSGGSMLGYAPQFYAAGAGTQTAQNLSFSNSNNVSFGLASSTIVGFGAMPIITGSFALRVTANNGSSADVSALAFTNTNNVGFALSTNAAGATLRAAASIQVSAGTTNGAQSVLSFANGSGVSFGLNASTITASVDPQIGVVSHVGGNVVSSVTRLAFSNASNVTFSLSTAANAATLLASVAAGGGGIAVSQVGGLLVSSGTLALINRGGLTENTNSTRASNNVVFTIDANSSMSAWAPIAVGDNLASNLDGFNGTKINFVDGNGITFGAATSAVTNGRQVNITASAFVPNLHAWNNVRGGQNDDIAGSAGTMSGMGICPIDGGIPMPGNITANTFALVLSCPGALATNSSFAITHRIGVYTLANSTQLSLVNSVSNTMSASSRGTAQGQAENEGMRLFSVHSSQWSSQPVFSNGVVYWLGYFQTQVNLSASLVARPMPRIPSGQRFGFLGSSVTASTGNFAHFAGALATTNIPASIALSQIITASSAISNASLSNMYQSIPVVAMGMSNKLIYP